MASEELKEDYKDEGVQDRPSHAVERQAPSSLNAEDKQWGMICHIAGVVGILGPLICWMVKKDSSAYVDYHGKEAVNFHLNILILALICGVTIVGIILIPVISIAALIMSIMAGMKANEGEYYQYPYIYRLIK
jgi:uncharacterized Tic20 family protein